MLVWMQVKYLNDLFDNDLIFTGRFLLFLFLKLSKVAWSSLSVEDYVLK